MREEAHFEFDTGEAWLDLLGTRWSSWMSTVVELLPAPESLDRWLRQVYPAHVISSPSTEEDLAAARELREALRAVAAIVLGLPEATGAPSPERALETVNRLAAESAAIQAKWDGSALALTESLQPREALKALASQGLTRLVAGPDALRSCLDESCRKIYLDDRGARKYCCTRCSGRARVRAYRERAGKP